MRGFKVRDLRNKGFFILDDAYLNGFARYLDPTTTVVYLSLCRHANKEQSSFPSQKLIADEHGLNPQTVKRKIKRLVECNIIKIIKKRSKKGKWINNVYYLLDKSEWKLPRGTKTTYGSPGVVKIKTRGSESTLKDTHTKGTHIKKEIIKKEKYSSLKDITEQDIREIAEKYHVPVGFVQLRLEEMTNWLAAKGRRYKDYRRALMNWVLRAAEEKIERRQNDRYRAVDARGIE